MPSIPSLFPIPLIQTAFDEDGAPRERAPDVYAFHRGTTQRNLYRIPVE